MTPEEIKALIQSALDAALPATLKSAFGEFNKHLEEQIRPINDRLGQFEIAGTPKEISEEPEVTKESKDPAFEALTNRLAKLEADNKTLAEKNTQREQASQQLRFENTLGSALAGKGNVLHQQLVSEILSSRLKSGAVEKDGEWFTKDGSKLSEAVDSFFGSEQGLHFLPSNHQNGTGTPATRQPAANTKQNAKDMSLDAMLADGMSF